MTQFIKQPQQEGSNISQSSLFNRSDGKLGPTQKKGTSNEKIADFFSQAKLTTIDFSALPIDDPQPYGINLGASGPPVTIGLGENRIQKATKEILVLQQRQERLLSKSSTNYSTPDARKSFNIMF
ncbi:MAG: hypothetical protein EZS28_037560 [Streblomastix strix]|uniref:Uncharacterized protein n=1 Tax=Streblomastix strix TaxID=222440 RepID=A0A5J4U9S4_9EUKA|nr:MAG: hypothetical protein EZS28_037560 [Streblomastix strix]